MQCRQTSSVPTCGCGPDEAGWQVGDPFGFDMVVVVVSVQPLIRQPRPAGEKAEAYLSDLQAALDEARRRGERVSVRAIAVETAVR